MKQRVLWVLMMALIAIVNATDFGCPPLPPHNATTVRDLRPADIKIVAAMGDSISAGMAIFGHFMEDRGYSWSIGGDKNTTTMPSILQSVSPQTLFGASTGYHIAEWPGWKYHAEDYCNGAQSASRAANLLGQIDHIQSVLQSTQSVDYLNDWKLFTILIGANNICGVCDTKKWDTMDSADKYEAAMRETLDKLHKTFPKSFVNLALMFNVSQVYYVGLGDPTCENRHKYLGPLECECVFGKNETARQLMDSSVQEYNSRLIKIANDYKKLDLSDFAVVIQPFLEGMKIPSPKYLSTFDCFHPSLIAHQSMAIGLWNNIITPAAKKSRVWSPAEKLICPDENTRLWTD